MIYTGNKSLGPLMIQTTVISAMYDGYIFWELENHQRAILVLVKKKLGKLQRRGGTEART